MLERLGGAVGERVGGLMVQFFNPFFDPVVNCANTSISIWCVFVTSCLLGAEDEDDDAVVVGGLFF